MSCLRTISRQSARNFVTALLSDEAVFNLSGFAIDAPQSTLVLSMKNPGMLAGVPFIDALVQQLECEIEWHVQEGVHLNSYTKVVSISGPTEELIHGEQLIKTILTLASSIATFAAKLKKLLNDFSWKGELISPLNLTPGFALVEEYAILVAGIPSSKNKSSVFLPSSHVDHAGGLKEAITVIKGKAGKNSQIIVECSSLQEAKTAAEAGATSIRFEGLTAKELGNFSSQLKSSIPTIAVEAVCNFDETTLRPYALPSVDSITTKKLCNGYPILDFKVTYEKFENPVKQSTQKRAAAPEGQEESSETGAGKMNGHDNESAKKARVESLGSLSTKSTAEIEKAKEKPAVAIKPETVKITPVKPVPTAKGDEKINPRQNENSNRAKNQRNQPNRTLQMQSQRFHTPMRQNQGSRSSSQTRRTNDDQHSNSPTHQMGINLRSNNMQQPQQQQMQKILQMQQAGAARFMNAGLNLSSGMISLPGQQPPQLALTNSLPLLRGNVSQNNPNSSSNFRMPPNQQRNIPVNQNPSLISGMNQFGPMLQNMSPQQVGNMRGQTISQCRVCGTPNVPGMTFCRNCRSPTR